MLLAVHLINVLLPLLYIITFLAYSYDFIKQQPTFYNSRRVIIALTLIIHCFYVVARTVQFNHPPITNKFEIFTLLACSIALAYFILELTTNIRNTGAFTIVIAAIFQIISSLFIQDLTEVKDVLRNNLLGVHVMSALLGYSGFALSAVYGSLFLVMYKKIKTNQFGLIFKRLPSLETLETLHFHSMLIGFILLTIAIVIGAIWLPLAFPNFKAYDLKLVFSSAVWLVYAVGLTSKFFGIWYGKKLVWFSLAGFAVTIASLIFTTISANSFHYFK